MKVIHLAKNDFYGGAARAALRLHLGLKQIGVPSEMLVQIRRSEDEAAVRYRPPAGLGPRFRRRFRRAWLEHEHSRYFEDVEHGVEGKFGDDRSRFGPDMEEQFPPADLINLHWVTGYVDFGAVGRWLRKGRKAVWTLHDMNPFTGGCHYAFDCRRFAAHCGCCPALNSADERDLSFQVLQRKQAALTDMAAGNLQIVAPSEWLAAEARRSSLFGRCDVSVIPYGVDEKVFLPRDRASARALLGIDPSRKVVLCAAYQINDPRKGAVSFGEALARLAIPGVTYLTVGLGQLAAPLSMDHVHVRDSDTTGTAGFITSGGERRYLSEATLSLMYSAADVFVLASTAENLSCAVMEAMACGTPVAAFDIGGTRDMVEPGSNGDLASPGDFTGLAEKVRSLLVNEDRRRELAGAARERVLERYTLERQARSYLALYERLLADETTPGAEAKR